MKVDKEKIDILETIYESTRYPINLQQSDISNNIEEAIFEDRNMVVEFCMDLVRRNESPSILQYIERETISLKRTERKEVEKTDELLLSLKTKDYYLFYRIFVGRDYEYLIHDDRDLESIRKEKENKINEIINKINARNISKWFHKIDRVAVTYSQEHDFDFQNLYFFCRNLGKEKPEIAKKFIELSLGKKARFSHFISPLLQGIKCSKEPRIAYNFIYEWLKSKKYDLILKIPDVYSFIDERFLADEDVKIFEDLVNFSACNSNQKKELDLKIFINTPYVYKKNPRKIKYLILKLFERATPEKASIYDAHLETAHIRKYIDFSNWEDEDWNSLIEHFVKIKSLSFYEIGILALYGERFPLELIYFFERRIKFQKSRLNDENFNYKAIPSSLNEIHRILVKNPRFYKVIERILKLIKKGHWIYWREGKELLKNISPSLKSPLEDIIKKLLLSDRKKDMLFGLKVLSLYSSELGNWELLKIALANSQGDGDVFQAVSKVAISVGVITGERGFLNTCERKVEKLEKWRDDEDLYVRNFAKKIIKGLKENIEKEKDRIEERKKRFESDF